LRSGKIGKETSNVKAIRDFVINAVIGGVLIVAPIYLAVLLLLKGVQSVVGLVKPIAVLLPEWMPAENLLAVLLVLVFCSGVGLAVRTRVGQSLRERMEESLLARLPGYTMLRSFTQQLAGHTEERLWKPALVEIEDALAPGFIVEELPEDDLCAVFVPSVPTPMAGAVYILDRKRVHPIDVPFTQAIRSVTQWGAGSSALVSAMKNQV
jgi:uncharacterized membrane protein